VFVTIFLHAAALHVAVFDKMVITLSYNERGNTLYGSRVPGS